MKRVLLLAFLICNCALLHAQTTPETALPLAEGTNSYTFEEVSYNNYVYYTYTAPTETGVLLIATLPNTNISVQASKDGTSATLISGLRSNNGLKWSYPIKSGETVFISASCYNSADVSFDIEIKEEANIGHGATCDDAITATTEQFFVPAHSYYDNQSFTNYTLPTYISYNCEEDGVLQMSLAGSPSGFTIQEGCDGTTTNVTTSYDYTTGATTANVEVTAGKQYFIALILYSPLMATFELTHPVIGASCDMPYTAQEIGNVLPAATGKYWYRYSPNQDGYIVLSSESTLPGGNISVYYSCNDYSPFASIDGHFGIRFTVNSYTTSYIICIEKTEATATDETFNLTFEPAQPGDLFSNPIVLTENTATTPLYNGTYYYSVTVPGEGSSFMNVTTTATLSGSSVALYNKDSQYNTLASGTNSLRSEVTGGQTYIIAWSCYEGINNFDFTISYESIAQGDICSNPLPAVAGENTLAAGAEKWYTYTATIDGYLMIDTDIDITVSFPYDCSSYSSSRATQKIATITKTEVTQGTTCLIKFSNVTAATTFFLEEAEYAEGESCATAIATEAGTINLPKQTLNVWYKYTATQDGMLVIDSNIDYEYGSTGTSMVSVKEGSCTAYPTSLFDYNNYIFKGSLAATAGKEYYINVVTFSAQADKTLSIAIRDYEPGESCANPMELPEGDIFLPLSKPTTPIWFYVDLLNGYELKVESVDYDYFDMAIYNDCAATSYLATSEYYYNDENYGYRLIYTATADGKYILKLNRTNNADTPVTVTIDKLSGLDAVKGENLVVVKNNNIIVTPNDATRTDVAIYDITGKLVKGQAIYNTTTFTAERGIYIVKVGDTVKKVVINR